MYHYNHLSQFTISFKYFVRAFCGWQNEKQMLLHFRSSTLKPASICLPASGGLCHRVAVISLSISFQFYYANIDVGGDAYQR